MVASAVVVVVAGRTEAEWVVAELILGMLRGHTCGLFSRQTVRAGQVELACCLALFTAAMRAAFGPPR